MPATDLTVEGRAIAKRMRQFPNIQGNISYLHKLVEDAAVLASLVPVAEATGDQAALYTVKQSAVACAAAEDSSGNLHMAELMTGLGRDLDGALDVIEGGGPPPPLVLPPANVDAPYVGQEGATLSCTMGNWNNMQEEPHSYAYQWRRDDVELLDAVNPTLTISAASEGRTFTCTVTATNVAGSAASVSNAHIAALP